MGNDDTDDATWCVTHPDAGCMLELQRVWLQSAECWMCTLCWTIRQMHNVRHGNQTGKAEREKERESKNSQKARGETTRQGSMQTPGRSRHALYSTKESRLFSGRRNELLRRWKYCSIRLLTSSFVCKSHFSVRFLQGQYFLAICWVSEAIDHLIREKSYGFINVIKPFR